MSKKTQITNPAYAKTRLSSQRGEFRAQPEAPEPNRPKLPPKSDQIKPGPRVKVTSRRGGRHD